MKDRIRQLMLHQHMSQQAFADILGLSPASLSSIFNDRTKPTLNHVDAIKKRFPTVNLDWLLYGNGSMFLDDEHGEGESSTEKTPFTGETQLDFGATEAGHPALNFDAPATPKTAYHAPKAERTVVQYVEKPQRQITEIRIFFDDQTWETFVPKK